MPTVAELNAALPPELEVVRSVGGGGQREVFLTNSSHGQVALKLMDASVRDRAEREVAAGRQFDHPNLVRVVDTDVHDLRLNGVDYCYFIEEFVEGTLVSSIATPLDGCEALRLMRDLVAAVEHLWTKHRIVHRDIKPNNIIRGEDGRFVLLDVGMGRHQLQPSLTLPLMIAGTPGFYSPEQVNPTRRNLLDHRSDFFLIAITAYHCVEHALPFDPASADYVTDLLTRNFRPYSNTPAELQTLLTRLLAPQPHQRFARFEQLYAELDSTGRALQCS